MTAIISFLTKVFRKPTFFLIALFLSMWSVSAAAATYYLYTPITGANTTFSSAVSSVWQFNVTNSFDFGGGSFTIKKNGSANRDDARFSLCTTLPANYSGGEPCTGANLVATTSIPYTSVPQSYTLTPIRFAMPITLSSGRTYYGVLWSATGSIGSKQYFVKGANSTFIADSTQTPIPSGYVSINNSAPQFNISKAASSSSVTTGSTITYTFTITNQGNLTAGAGSTITVADKLPSNVTYVTRSETAITGLDSSGSTAPSCVFDSTVGSTTVVLKHLQGVAPQVATIK